MFEFDPMRVKDALEIDNPEVFEPLEVPIHDLCWNIVKYNDISDNSMDALYEYKGTSFLKKDNSIKKTHLAVKKDAEEKLARIDELMK